MGGVMPPSWKVTIAIAAAAATITMALGMIAQARTEAACFAAPCVVEETR
ncbi:hypothetical protein PQB71_gp84 [Mycobacterium phage Taptic]|uniref:Uncharacterized protein n=1 Tax=Mycobacterium phage Taptic TaxID=1920305 RepID=A0A1J0ME50_9CAUD|nr:hypothetical protein PQB71_gp84 [Mycobacterium phage Taptic]APD19307.1 hypothetical protein SEA_TAPTIC_81 [Mycobacterium phage Taptic]BBC28603.1 hypothetical protein [Mycobacterium phage D12]